MESFLSIRRFHWAPKLWWMYVAEIVGTQCRGWEKSRRALYYHSAHLSEGVLQMSIFSRQWNKGRCKVFFSNPKKTNFLKQFELTSDWRTFLSQHSMFFNYSLRTSKQPLYDLKWQMSGLHTSTSQFKRPSYSLQSNV